MSRGIIALCCLLVAAVGCVAPGRGARRARSAPAPSAIVAALARREQATRGLRLSMTVRLTGDDRASALPSPAYLAIDGTGAIRLQVLSAFGMTVLDLAIHGDAYTLALPLRHQTTDGRIDLRTLDDPAVAVSDRMIVALALLFRPKARPATCTGAEPWTVTCRVAPDLAARLTVDDALRPVREEYRRDDGSPLLVATYDDYRGDDPAASPGSLRIADSASGASMAIQVRRARVVATSPS